MNNQLRITYNPYAKTIAYAYQSKPDEGWKTLEGESDLSKFRKGALQNYAEEIVRIIIREFCTDGKGVDLIFRGTQLDWEDLKEIVRQIDSEHRIHCLDSAFEEMISADNALAEIEKIFKELSDQFEASQDLEVKRYIDQYLDATRPEIVLVAVGTYSAGKSSFINALIGEEVLPTASMPTTAKIFKISSQPEGMWYDTRIRFKYGTQDVELYFNERGYCLDAPSNLPDLELKYCLDVGLKDVAPSAAYVYHTISILNKFNELKCGNAKNLIAELIEIYTPFHCSTLPLDTYQFTIYDLPGPNTPNYKGHREVLKKALAEQTNGVPVFVVEPDSMSSDSVDELRKEISEIEALDANNIMIVVNKADQKDPDTLSENIHNSDGVAVMKDAENRVFCVSSVVGLGAKKDDMTHCVAKDILRTYRRLEREFLNGEMVLFEVDDALPRHLYHSICSEGKAANTHGNSRKKLLHNSGLWALEHEITRFAEKYAAFNKCQQAQKYLSLAIEKVNKNVEFKKEESENLLGQITGQLDNQKQWLICELKEKCKQMYKDHSYSYQEKIKGLIDAGYGIGSPAVTRPALQEQWKHVKKDETKMQDWIASHFKAMQTSFASSLYTESHAFWKVHMDFFKKKCLEIVTESEVFSETEHEFLKQYILNCPQPVFGDISFDFDVQAKKAWRFLFWSGKDFDLKTCVNNMERLWKDNIGEASNRYLSNVQSTIKQWYELFIGGLVDQFANFNPQLKNLVKKREQCQDEISRLKAIRGDLLKNQNIILGLFQFDNEEA